MQKPGRSYFVRSLALGIASIIALGASSGSAEESSLEGCLAASGNAQPTLAWVYSIAPWLPEFPGLGVTIDAQLSVISSDAAKAFEVSPNMRLYDDQDVRHANAFATAANSEGSSDGSMRLGVNLVASEIRRFMNAEWGRTRLYAFTITAVIAHELAHIAQVKRGKAKSGRNTELQADYLAGWYFATLQAQAPLHFESNKAIEDGVSAFFSRGDYQFTSRQHHGTPELRRDAFLRGFRAGPKSFEEAWSDSVDFRSELGG